MGLMMMTLRERGVSCSRDKPQRSFAALCIRVCGTCVGKGEEASPRGKRDREWSAQVAVHFSTLERAVISRASEGKDG